MKKWKSANKPIRALLSQKILHEKITLHKSSAWNLVFSEYSLWKDIQWEKNEIYCLNESVYTNLEKTASKHTVRSSSILFFFRTLKSTNKKILCWHTYSFCPNTSDGLSNWAFHFMIAPLKSETGSLKSLLYHYTSYPLLLQKFILPKISCEFKDFYGKVVIETFPWPKQ